MAENKDHITHSEEYKRYLGNQMTPKERYAFEKRMLESEFESEALEGLSEFSDNELQSDLNELQAKLHKKTRLNTGLVYWRAAAAILLLGVFSFIIYFVINNNSKTESLQSRDLQMEERHEEAQNSTSIIHDSVAKEEPPVIAYSKKVEEEKPKVVKKETHVDDEEVVENLIELDLALAEEDMVQGEVVMDEMEPAELPTIQNEQKTEVQPMPVEKSISGRVAGVTMPSNVASSKELEMPIHSKTISGKVYSTEDDEVLPGVNVIVKGSTAGTVSDIEGNYSISVPDSEEVTLVFSSVGYMTEEVTVGEESEIDVDFVADVSALSEIVVVGYGTESEEEPDYSYIPPRPEGGRNVFRDFIKENIQYPPSGLEQAIKGTVKLKFTVSSGGNISNIEILKSLGSEFDKEAIRLLKEGPDWEPAELNGNTEEREVKVKIRFRPPE